MSSLQGVRGVRQESRKFGRAIAVGTKSRVPALPSGVVRRCAYFPYTVCGTCCTNFSA